MIDWSGDGWAPEGQIGSDCKLVWFLMDRYVLPQVKNRFTGNESSLGGIAGGDGLTFQVRVRSNNKRISTKRDRR